MQWIQRYRAFLVAVFVLLLSTTVHGQAVYGSLYGTVMDNTGASIPGANITVTNSGKGTSVEATSNGTGEFRVDHLIPDIYDVKVTAANFKPTETKGIQIFADSSFKVDFSLQIGSAASESVEVNADSVPLLKTDRADVATTFESKTISDLPVGNRNFTNLQLLLPGAQTLGWSHAADENPQGSKQIQVDGQAFGGVAFELDGTDNQDPILGIIVINPPLDALSETKITTQNFDAEFGKAVSSIVTAQTKSGSNKFHGSAFDYRQSNATQARDPFTQNPTAGGSTSGLVPSGLYNQFGGSIGGPIIKDKLFFFGDYQGLRQKVGTAASMTVPSALLISTCLGQSVGPGGIPGCDFSEYATALKGSATAPFIYNNTGTTSVPWSKNVIPTAYLSPQNLGLLKLLQPYKPNKTGSYNGLQNNYGGSGAGLFNNNQFDIRGDYQVSQKIHAFGRYSRFTSTLTGKTLFGEAGGAGFGINGYGGNSTGTDNSVASGVDWAVSNTLVTDFRFGYYSYSVTGAKFSKTNLATQLGIPGMNTGTGGTDGAPGWNVTDVGTYGTPNNAQSAGEQYGSGLNITRCNCPLIEQEHQYQVVNNWTKIWGNHAIKFGADLRFAHNLRVPSDTDRTGLMDYSTGPTSNGGQSGTGLGLATMVLGNVTKYGRYVSTSTNAREYQPRLFFYGQDTWRATPKLTVNYGLRYEIYLPEKVNAAKNGALMDLKTGYLHVAGVGSVPDNMGWDKAAYPFNPRIGVAYQVTPRTVIRSGYGRSFDIGVFGSIFGHVVTQNLPILANQSISTGSTTGYVFCTGPNTAGCTQPAGQPAGGGPVALAPTVVPSNGLLPAPGYSVQNKARPNSLRLPTVDAWNLSLQQALTSSLTLTMAYVANKGTHTLSAGDGNNTNPNEAAIFLPASYSVTGAQLHYDPNGGNCYPLGSGCTQANVIKANGATSNTNFLRRYYGGSLAACRDSAYSTPSGLVAGQCGWNNDISYYGNDQDSHFNALQVTLAKQFTHGLSFTGNYAWQRGIDFGNTFVTWQRNASKGRNNDIREQQFVIYGLYELPFGRNKMYGANSSAVMNQIIGGWQLSPVLTWSSGLPFSLGLSGCGSWTPGSAPCYPNGQGGFLKTSLGGYDAVKHRRLFFNAPSDGSLPAGFSYPTLDQIGTAGRNNKFGPGFFNMDLALQKNFPIWESVLLQFRMDAANVFNHINPGNPGGSINQGPQYITGQAPGAAARQLQFSLRIQF